MNAESTSVAAALEVAVAAVPGVKRLYPASGLANRLATAVGSAITGAEPQGDGIVVSGSRIAIRIGVDGEPAAAEVCRAVYAVAREWAAGAGLASPTIEVTVVGID